MKEVLDIFCSTEYPDYHKAEYKLTQVDKNNIERARDVMKLYDNITSIDFYYMGEYNLFSYTNEEFTQEDCQLRVYSTGGACIVLTEKHTEIIYKLVIE